MLSWREDEKGLIFSKAPVNAGTSMGSSLSLGHLLCAAKPHVSGWRGVSLLGCWLGFACLHWTAFNPKIKTIHDRSKLSPPCVHPSMAGKGRG